MNTRFSALLVTLFSTASLAVPSLTPTEISRNNRDSVVLLSISGTDANGVPKESIGTGVILSQAGHVLAPLHAIQDSQGVKIFDSYTVSGAVGSRVEPRRTMILLRTDPAADLMLLKFEGDRKDYVPVTKLCLGPTRIEDGDRVVTIGFPKGSERSVLEGTISNSGAGKLWQTSLQVIYGYSGAPVFATSDSRVVGFIAGGTPGVDGRNFITPLHEANGLLSYLPTPPSTCPAPSGAELLQRYLEGVHKGVCDIEILESEQLARCRTLIENFPPGVVKARLVGVDHAGAVTMPNGQSANDYMVSYQSLPSQILRMWVAPSGKIQQVVPIGIATGRIIDPNTGQELRIPRQ